MMRASPATCRQSGGQRWRRGSRLDSSRQHHHRLCTSGDTYAACSSTSCSTQRAGMSPQRPSQPTVPCIGGRLALLTRANKSLQQSKARSRGLPCYPSWVPWALAIIIMLVWVLLESNQGAAGRAPGPQEGATAGGRTGRRITVGNAARTVLNAPTLPPPCPHPGPALAAIQDGNPANPAAHPAAWCRPTQATTIPGP